MDGTPRFSLPYLSAGQSQKEITHNEALQILDFAVAGNIVEPPRNDPPGTPLFGDCYIVGAAPTGAWVGWTDAIAGYSAGGWRRIVPVPGMEVYVQSLDQPARYTASGWEIGALRGQGLLIDGQQVVGARASPIADPAGGAVVDAECRESIVAILTTLREHGLISS